MGMNYYALTGKECPHTCEVHEREQGVHLGKSSHGWRFNFNLNRREYYFDVPSMKEWLKDKKIIDEEGREWSHEEFWAKVEAKQSEKYPDPNKPGYNHDGHDINIGGYNFLDMGEFS